MKKFFQYCCVLFFILGAAVQASGQECKGMTWAVRDIKGQFVRVGNTASTNPYQGDTPCHKALPILAIKVIGAKRPNIIGVTYDYYQGWCKGFLKLTPPVKGSHLTSLDKVNHIIRKYLGKGWRMAEHHDGGGGWSYWGYGKIPKDTRFWVYINDQRANPWNSGPASPRTPTDSEVEFDFPLPMNLAQLASTTVSASSVNGNRSPDNPYYGVLNLFDGGSHFINGINYTTWLTDSSPRHWVYIKFAGPVILNKIMIECVYSTANRSNLVIAEKDAYPVYPTGPQSPREFAVDIVTETEGVQSIEKLPSVPINGFRVFYPIESLYENVVAVKLVFPGTSLIELSEIEVIGIPQQKFPVDKGTPAVASSSR
jgi:hypothetical protein